MLRLEQLIEPKVWARCEAGEISVAEYNRTTNTKLCQLWLRLLGWNILLRRIDMEPRIVKLSEVESLDDYPEDTIFELDEDGGRHRPERKLPEKPREEG